MNFFETKWDGKLKPEILCQPNVPKPLHGLNPRTIKGKEWWDIKRQEVYASTNYHCIACGTSKQEAKGYQWCEAHEYWDIDYETGRCEIISIEPLCHYCHNFIHSGRLSMILGKEKTKNEVIEILEHGFRILHENNLKCFYGTYVLASHLGAETYGVKPKEVDLEKEPKWEDYHLVFENKIHKSKFKNYEKWLEYYS